MTEETKSLPDVLEQNEYLKESLVYEQGLLGKVNQQAQETILNLQQQINLSKDKIQEFGKQKEVILSQTAEEKALTDVLKQKSVDNLKQLQQHCKNEQETLNKLTKELEQKEIQAKDL